MVDSTKDKDSKQSLPDQKTERELSDFIAKKYGQKAKIVTPQLCPETNLNDDGPNDGVWSKINFDMLPEELVAYLDQYLVCQDEAKAVLATKVCTHFNRAKLLAKTISKDPADGVGLIKNNILMIGPTGVGKTYMVKLIAAKLGVPFVKGDATKFSETGYVGGDVEDLIRDLLQEADDDIELAQYGIIYVDEVDKIASSRNLIGPDVSRTGVQRALLKPMEETEVDLKVPHDPISQIQAIEKYRKTGKKEKRTINTRHILFIMSGAFNDLPELVKKRLNQNALGFEADVRETAADQEYFKKATAQDLVEYGFESEFVGRLPVCVMLDALSADDLYEILKNPNNPVVISKKRDFAAYGIDLRFTGQALRILADRAAELKTGARALVSVMEKALIIFEKHLPSTDIKRLLVTPELVNDPKAHLVRLLADPQQTVYTELFEDAVRAERMEILKMIARRKTLYLGRLEGPLTPTRMDLIADEYYRTGMSLGTAFENVLKRLEQLRDFENAFYSRFSLEIHFSEAAESALLSWAAAQRLEVPEACQRLSHILEPGLRLVRDRTGTNDFVLPEEAVTDTDSYLHTLFKEHYHTNLDQRPTGAA